MGGVQISQITENSKPNPNTVILSEAKNPRISLEAPIHSSSMPRFTQAYVYILANHQRRLYTGVTTRLAERVNEHKNSIHPTSFTSRYNINKLVYYEGFADINQAIARETQIKGWLRIKKIQLIVAGNPTWQDLSRECGQRIEPFDETKLNPSKTF
jgi:putative endonuclease